MRFARYWLPLLAYCAAIFALSSQPVGRSPLSLFFDFPHADKLAHLLEYSLLGALAVRALLPGTAGFLTRGEALAVTVLFGLCYGAIDEIHQSYVPGRSMELLDLGADVTGATVAAALYVGWRRRRAQAEAP